MKIIGKDINKKIIKEYIYRLKWVNGYAKKHFWFILLYTLIGMSGAVISILGGLKSKDVVDIITTHRTGDLLKAFVLMILIQLISVGISSLSNYVSTYIRLRVENDIKRDVYEKIMTTNWEELNRYNSGQIISRWSGDCAVVANGMLNSIPNFFIFLFRFLSSLYMVLRYDATFAIFAVVSIPLSLFVSKQNLKRMKRLDMESMEINSDMSVFTQNSFSDIQNIKALDMVKLYINRLKDLQKRNSDCRMKNQRISMINSIVLILCSQLINYATYGWGVYRVWHAYISYGTMTMFLSLSQSLSGSAQNLINIVPSTISLANSAKRVMEIVDLPKEDYSDNEIVDKFMNDYSKVGMGIEIFNAEFTYQKGTKVFHNASMFVKPREIVGVIGPSGEGKTTMLRLILAIVNSTQGNAVVFAGDERNDDRCINVSAATRKLFAYVPQGNTMFSGTIADNMRNVKEDATDEEIIEALKEACAWEFVCKLPDTINTELREKGGGLSEGQSQRLAIARALLRKSPILLLDEATSALDIETQRRVMNNIMNDSYPRACIITTHRKEVMDICDRVYSIEQENLVENNG